MRRLAPRLDRQDLAAPSVDAAPGLRLEHVSAAHAGSQVAILHDISLHIGAGERVALIGPSGAGKSTLLAIAARELAPLARRLALARLFLLASDVWLLDEATEALNAQTAVDVLQRLRARSAGRSLLIATHLRREAALADRLLSLRDGRIVGDARRGTPAFEAALAGLRGD
eukprot:gene23335-27980_t